MRIEKFQWQPPVFTEDEAAAMAITLKGETPGVGVAPVLMGLTFDSILLGIMLSLFLIWSAHSRKQETAIIRYAVFWNCTWGLISTVVSATWIVHLFAFNFGSFIAWTDNRWVSFFPFIDTCMVICVQCFYADRAYKIAGRAKVVIIAVGFPLIVSVTGACGVAVSAFLKREIDQRYNNFAWMWVCGTFIADVVVTAVVLVGLFRQRSEWEQTDNLIKRLILISCESQLPPTLLAFGLMLDFAIQGDSYFAVFFEMVQGKFYVVGMIYVLNSRFALRRDMDGGGESFKPNTYSMNQTHRSRVMGPATIHVQTETYIESHQINPAFKEHKIQPKLREPSEADETDFASSPGGSHHNIELGNANQSEVGLNSEYQDRAHRPVKRAEFGGAYTVG